MPTDNANACQECNKSPCKHTLIYTLEIPPNETKEFNFKIIFLQAIAPTQLKFELHCELPSDNIKLVDKTESNPLTVQSRTLFLLRNLGERFEDAFLVAILLYFFEKGLGLIPKQWELYVVIIVLAPLLFQSYKRLFSKDQIK